LLVGLNLEDDTEENIEDLLRIAMGDDYSHGAIQSASGLFHLVRPELPQSRERPSPSILAWRIRDSVLEIAPDAVTLDTILHPEVTLGDTTATRMALRSQEETSACVMLLTPSLLSDVFGSGGQWLGKMLNPDFRISVTVGMENNDIVLRSNIGIWTLIAALTTATLKELDRVALSELNEKCTLALKDLCRNHPDSALCQPMHRQRLALAKKACDALRTDVF